MLIRVYFVAVALAIMIGGSFGGRQTQLKDLLLSLYDKENLPSYDSVNNVSFALTLQFITNVDLFGNSMEVSAYQQMSWDDSRLAWNPEDFNVSEVDIPVKKLWIPDIVVSNSLGSKDLIPDLNARVYYTGHVSIFPASILKTTCVFDISMYPYDMQKCTLTWLSWTQSTYTIRLSPLFDHVDVASYLPNPTWELVRAPVTVRQQLYECCPEEYEMLDCTIVIRRRNASALVGPAVINVWLIVAVFLMTPAAYGKRIVFAGLVSVALVVQAMALSGEVPAYMTTRLGRYLLAGMVLSAIIIVINALLFACNASTSSPASRSHVREHLVLQEKDETPASDDRRRRTCLFVDIGLLVVTMLLLAVITAALFI
ncbi:neuronal acetylcholine receptor subunit alpha-2-like [Diadema antillarum]|uniref:neuronal acetylcholine receptor subunit alpha-2-like n=1 Tax=Diadema antillarum TaxID=105358 RepID=UPI003A88A502